MNSDFCPVALDVRMLGFPSLEVPQLDGNQLCDQSGGSGLTRTSGSERTSLLAAPTSPAQHPFP